MTLEEIRQITLTILASAGGVGAIILLLSSWIGKVWADKLYQRRGAKYQKDIEELKAR